MKVKDAMVRTISADRAGGFLKQMNERISRQASRLSAQAGRLPRRAPVLPPHRRRGIGSLPLIVGGVIGGLLAYFLDPAHGRSRRTQAVARLQSVLHGFSRQLNRVSRGMNAQTIGLKHRVVHLRSSRSVGDDTTIADRVESAVFRETGLPKGGVSVDVRNGIVVLRGELPRPDQIVAIERATRRIYGVAGVENLLHLPGTPAPQEAERRQTTA